MNPNKKSSIEIRQDRQKAAVVEQLRRTPVVQVACEKAGIARATYYRWMNEDSAFAAEARNALVEGVALVCDMAESQILTLIRGGNLGAIMFWLRSRHRAYSRRIEMEGNIDINFNEELRKRCEKYAPKKIIDAEGRGEDFKERVAKYTKPAPADDIVADHDGEI